MESLALKRSNKKQTATPTDCEKHSEQQAQACLPLLLSKLICWAAHRHMATLPLSLLTHIQTQIPDTD